MIDVNMKEILNKNYLEFKHSRNLRKTFNKTSLIPIYIIYFDPISKKNLQNKYFLKCLNNEPHSNINSNQLIF